MEIKIQSGQSLTCINDGYLKDNEYKPNLKKGDVYQLKRSVTCGCGQIHYDVGLTSTLNYISCYKCREDLPEASSGKTHWANSSRFIVA
jgi:hypothetical protein